MEKISREGRVLTTRRGNPGQPKGRGGHKKLGSVSKTDNGGRNRSRGSQGDGSKRE